MGEGCASPIGRRMAGRSCLEARLARHRSPPAQLYEQHASRFAEVLTRASRRGCRSPSATSTGPAWRLMGYPRTSSSSGSRSSPHRDRLPRTLSTKGRPSAGPALPVRHARHHRDQGLQLGRLLERANRNQVPVLRHATRYDPVHPSAHELPDWFFAPSVTVHASLVTCTEWASLHGKERHREERDGARSRGAGTGSVATTWSGSRAGTGTS